MVNCSDPVGSPQPSSMIPLQLSSTALKQSSGPVGVHASTSVTPGEATRFVAWIAAGDARGAAGGAQAASAIATPRSVLNAGRG
jgi:hypothetical protein